MVSEKVLVQEPDCQTHTTLSKPIEHHDTVNIAGVPCSQPPNLWAYFLPSFCIFDFVLIKCVAIEYVNSNEVEELVRLRIRIVMDIEGGEDAACNLIGCCLKAKRFEEDYFLMMKHYDLLDRLDRLDEYRERVCVTWRGGVVSTTLDSLLGVLYLIIILSIIMN